MPAREPRTAPVRGLKTQPRRELERARAAGAERLTDTLVRLPERLRGREVVTEVGQVRDVEDVEHVAADAQVNLLFEPECLRHAEVLRTENIAELVTLRERDRGIRLREALHKQQFGYASGRLFPGQRAVVLTYGFFEITLAEEAAESQARHGRVSAAGIRMRPRRIKPAHVGHDRRMAQECGERRDLEIPGQIHGA